MPLSLTCDCGARFEVDDALAGQSVACPECQQPLKAPSLQRPTVRTSGFALASFLLAIVGAFTVVGTVAAVVLGLIAVVRILRDRERVAGLGFAGFGVGLGVAFTAITLWAVSNHELFGLGAALRRTQMADQLDPLDPKAPLEMQENGFSLTRPTAKWARAKKGFQYPLVQPLLRNDALLLLVQPDLYAFIDVQSEANNRLGPAVEDFILNQLKQDPTQPALNNDKVRTPPKFGGLANDDEDDAPEISRITKVTTVGTPKALPEGAGVQQANEMTAEATVDGKRWTVLVRTYQMTSGRLFIVRGYAETSRFARAKDELVKALDSFKASPGF
jgi:hypothetical protein